MKPTDLGQHLTTFLGQYLPGQRRLSANTIRSYRDTFMLLLRFCRDERGLGPEKLRVSDWTASLLVDFLAHLEEARKCSVRTRNQRLAAIHAFAHYLLPECPEALLQLQRVLLIPIKKHPRGEVRSLSGEEMALILRQPNAASAQGRRDQLLLSLLYDTGARVQELIDLRLCDVRLESPAQVRLTGKGGKMRSVPLLAQTVQLLTDYLRERRLEPRLTPDRPVFENSRGSALSRSGIRYILEKHVQAARAADSSMPSRISPHTLRHTKAMHLLQAGNPLVIIRNILGHADVSTTEVYARADMKMKRQALEKAAGLVPQQQAPSWHRDKDLLNWLKSL